MSDGNTELRKLLAGRRLTVERHITEQATTEFVRGYPCTATARIRGLLARVAELEAAYVSERDQHQITVRGAGEIHCEMLQIRWQRDEARERVAELEAQRDKLSKVRAGLLGLSDRDGRAIQALKGAVVRMRARWIKAGLDGTKVLKRGALDMIAENTRLEAEVSNRVYERIGLVDDKRRNEKRIAELEAENAAMVDKARDCPGWGSPSPCGIWPGGPYIEKPTEEQARVVEAEGHKTSTCNHGTTVTGTMSAGRSTTWCPRCGMVYSAIEEG